jgi:hypothetical protein
LLQQPSLLQLRLTILTKQGCEGCSRDTSDPPFRRVNLFRRWLRHAPASPPWVSTALICSRHESKRDAFAASQPL